MAATETRWWWLRHAPVIDPKGGILGRRDVDCDLSGRDALAAAARRLPRGAVWIVSSLRRTRQTALALQAAGAEAAPLRAEPDLDEQDLGAWQGRGFDGIGVPDGPLAELTPPGGESFAAVQARVAAAIERLAHDLDGRDIVAIAHAGTIRAALGHALGLPPERALAVVVDPLALTRLDRIGAGSGPGWRIGCVNRPACD